jgi:hypothetical protein
LYIQKFQKAAGSKISVTTSAAYIFDLINTAQSTTLANAGFTSKTNAIILRPEDGDIRILFNDLAPTSTDGFLVKSGEVLTLANVPLKSMKLISTSGTVVCSIQVGITSEDESSSLITAGGSSVAVTSLIPGTGAANLGKAEDAAHTSGDTGVMALAVRNDAGTALAGTTGDYIPLTTDDLGSLRVNAGAMTDDAAFTVATSKVVPMGALADETATDSVDEGDIGAPRMTLDRRVITAGQILDDAAFGVGTSYVSPIGALADETSTDSVDEGDTGAVRMTLDRRLQVKAGTALEGPGNPVIDSYATVAINLTTGANQVLVSSAADKQIWVYGYAFTVGDAAGQTVSLQDEDDTALTGIMEFAQYGGISVPPSGNFAMPVFKLATDKDLEIDITGGDVDGWLAYAIVSV